MKRSTITAIAGFSLGILLIDAIQSGSYTWAAFGLLAAGLFLFFERVSKEK